MERSFGVAAHAREQPGKMAIVFGDRRVTYEELDADANRAARVLASCGAGEGRPVAIALRNRPEWLAVAIGAARVHAQVVPVAARSTAAEIEFFVADTGAAVVVGEPGVHAPAGVAKLSLGGRWEEATSAESPDALGDAPELGYVSLIPYTSGTTGAPKAVNRPRGTETSNLLGMLAYHEAFGTHGRDEVNLTCTPLHHLAGFSYAHAAVVMGQTLVLADHFDAQELLAAINRERVTYLNLVPFHFLKLSALAPDVAERYDLSSVRCLLHGSAPCPVDVKYRMFDLFGDVVWETYGGTEGMGTRIGTAEWRERPGSVGRPVLPDGVRVLDALGKELPPSAAGFVYLAQPEGSEFWYEGAPELTASVYRGRLFTLGDIGYVDDDGYLFLVDRGKDVVNTGGVNVYPAEVESVLRRHRAVFDVAVVGAPDDEYGERVTALVVPQAPVTGDVLDAFCRMHLVSYKCPRAYEFVDELPRDVMGKVQKRALRDRYWAGHATRI